MSPVASPAAGELSTVANRIAAQIEARLEGHGRSGDAFVVSVYGEWGIGKTRCLRSIEAHFNAALDRAIADAREATPDAVVVPVFFDPWQYEHEEHLVVPLLKTIELALRRVAEGVSQENPRPPAAPALATRLRDAGEVFGDVAVALLSAFKFKFAPLKEIVGIDIDFAPKDAFEASRKAAELRAAAKAPRARGWLGFRWGSAEPPAPAPPADAPEAAALARLAQRESLYFDVRSALARLTREGRPRLRLVILIDDLDRCLPEKAIQVLESVKLFLNVPGFSFVLAVDDEVVERGIAHRYKDYQPPGFPLTVQAAAPISGAEYLEKIVHLPVHLQRWAADEATAFLREGFTTLFGEADPRAAALLVMVMRSVPLVPRKLIRLAEALEFQQRQFEALGAAAYWHPLHAARVVILQQLYPALYRHLRLGAGRYWRMFEMGRNEYGDPAIGDGRDLETLRNEFNERARRPADPASSAAQRSVETSDLREQLTLLDLVEQAGRQRGAPDPLQLFAVPADSPERLAASIGDGLTLEDFARLYVHGVKPLQPQAAPASGTVAHPVAEVASPDVLVAALTRADTVTRRQQIEGGQLEGKRLPDGVFDELLQRLKDEPASASRMVETAWLRDLASITSPEQLLRLYVELDLLARVQAAQGGTSR